MRVLHPPGKLRIRMLAALRRQLLRTQTPRVQMFIILLATGAAGFLFSVILAHLGVTRMGIRYPLAVGFAYLVFFLLLRIWLEYQLARLQGRRDVADSQRASLHERRGRADFPDLSGLDFPVPRGTGGTGSSGEPFRFGGGSTGGGGASGTIDAMIPPTSHVSTGVEEGGGFIPDIPADLDEGWVVVIPLIAAGVALIASFYIVYSSPTLLAEVLLDGLLLTGLYKRLRGVAHRHWVVGAIRRTWIPVVIVAVIFSGAGFLIQRVVPEARYLWDIW